MAVRIQDQLRNSVGSSLRNPGKTGQFLCRAWALWICYLIFEYSKWALEEELHLQVDSVYGA